MNMWLRLKEKQKKKERMRKPNIQHTVQKLLQGFTVKGTQFLFEFPGAQHYVCVVLLGRIMNRLQLICLKVACPLQNYFYF